MICFEENPMSHVVRQNVDFSLNLGKFSAYFIYCVLCFLGEIVVSISCLLGNCSQDVFDYLLLR